ncbi:hypothetical protein HDU93_009017 [Gonapodya sp. JEL0774]|nr:hypothetical protein HDU93_009017 [Gonapodya sp. JEL0774]
MSSPNHSVNQENGRSFETSTPDPTSMSPTVPRVVVPEIVERIVSRLNRDSDLAACARVRWAKQFQYAECGFRIIDLFLHPKLRTWVFDHSRKTPLRLAAFDALPHHSKQLIRLRHLTIDFVGTAFAAWNNGRLATLFLQPFLHEDVKALDFWDVAEEDEEFAAVWEIFDPLLGNLKRLTVESEYDLSENWDVGKALAKSEKLEVFGHHLGDGYEKFELPSHLQDQLKVLAIDLDRITNLEDLEHFSVLESLSITPTFIGRPWKLGFLHNLKKLTALQLQKYRCNWSEIVSLLAAIGGQLHTLRLEPYERQQNRQLNVVGDTLDAHRQWFSSEVVESVVRHCPNLVVLEFANYQPCLVKDVLQTLVGLPQLRTLSLMDIGVTPDMAGKLAVDAVVDARSTRTKIFFYWGVVSQTPLGEESVWTADITLGGCAPLGAGNLIQVHRSLMMSRVNLCEIF